MQKREIPEFTSRLTKLQTVLVLLWLPVHVIGLPLLLILLGVIDAVELNFLLYVVGALFLLVVGFRFLRRDFDALADHPGRILLTILSCYGTMLLLNLAASGVL